MYLITAFRTYRLLPFGALHPRLSANMLFSNVSTVPVQFPYGSRTVPVTVPVGILRSSRGFRILKKDRVGALVFYNTKTTGTV